MIIDSLVSDEEALRQNPSSIAPPTVLEQQRVLAVFYRGFDGLLHRGQIVMHEAVVDDVRDFFTAALAIDFPIKSVIPISHPEFRWDDERSCNANNSSGFNYRLAVGNKMLSNHALGLAFDINPRQNPYIGFDVDGAENLRIPIDGVYDDLMHGTLSSQHPLVMMLKNRGWTWGGDWLPSSGRVDYQHFEKPLPIL